MTLIVETGTGASNSEAYCSVDTATTYHAIRGNSTWALLTTAQMEEALRRATDYIEQRYAMSWQGWRVSSSQALAWPRSGVVYDGVSVSSSIIPQSLINATAELALRAAAGELEEDLTRGILREKVGALEVEYDAKSHERKRYIAVENMLKPLFLNQSNMYVGLTRA